MRFAKVGRVKRHGRNARGAASLYSKSATTPPRPRKREREQGPRPPQKTQRSAELQHRNKLRRILRESKMATVTVRSLEEGPECGTVVTLDTFRSWKRECGRNTAFAVQISDVNGDGVLICSFAAMKNTLP